MIRIFLIAVCIVIGTFIFALLGLDFIVYLRNRYCRFHIGRWCNDKSWEESVIKVCQKWAIHTPTVKLTDNSRYILLDYINGKYRTNEIQTWQSGEVLLALAEDQSEISAKQYRNGVEKWIDKTGNWKQHPKNVDAALLGYAILLGSTKKLDVKPAMDALYELICLHLDENQLIRYTNSDADTDRYIDTAGMVCPFLMLYGNIFKNQQAKNIAWKQLEFYHNYDLHSDSHLPNHAINVNTKLPLGIYGWGRGVAWYIISLIDTYDFVEDDKKRVMLKEWILTAAEDYKRYQNDDGGFGSIFGKSNSYDSSITAVMAHFYQRCGAFKNSTEYYNIAENALNKLVSVTRINGKIDWCQGDTKAIGVCSQTYDIMPFAQAYTMRAIMLKRKR